MPSKSKSANLRLARSLRKKALTWSRTRQDPSDEVLGRRFIAELDKVIQRLSENSRSIIWDHNLSLHIGKLVAFGRFLFFD
jgi:hypothetical protein